MKSLTMGPIRNLADDDEVRSGFCMPSAFADTATASSSMDGDACAFMQARLLKWESIAAIIEERELSSRGNRPAPADRIIACERTCRVSKPPEANRSLNEGKGWSATEVATKLGFSRYATVSRLLAMSLELPESMQRASRKRIAGGKHGLRFGKS